MSADDPFPFDATQQRFVLSHAYVPEHIPALMAAVSRATPLLINDYLCFSRDNWVIFVGYPLGIPFDSSICDKRIAHILDLLHPDYLWYIGPEIPPSLAGSCRSRQSDRYLRIDLNGWKIKPALQREVKIASKFLTVERGREFMQEHQSLVDELTSRENLPPLVHELYRSMPTYIGECESALVFNARDTQGNLTAFFVVEGAAERFDVYVLGCYSKAHYIPHASDLLFYEMISYARKRGKSEIDLGLSVNEGIRRFKTKWGGFPYLNYEFCECYYGLPKGLTVLEAMLGENH